MKNEECIAMIFTDGQETGLGALTDCLAKPALFYGGGHRIIDFVLNNCSYSGLNIVGILTQHSSKGLASYIEDNWARDLFDQGGGVFMLPPGKNGQNYLGAADAVYRNIDFIERISPKYVCVLSGDHIYKMDYAEMLDAHKRTDADVTIAVTSPFFSGARHEAVDTDEKGTVLGFRTPPAAGSDLVSMSIYIFTWDVLRRYLTAESRRGEFPKKFGKDVIPAMLFHGEKLYAYRFRKYWRDVETVENLWESNMDLLRNPSEFSLGEKSEGIFASFCSQLSYFTKKMGTINWSILSGLHVILGRVEHSVLSDSVVVESGAEIVDSVLMPNVYIGKNTRIYKTLVGPNVKIMDNVEIGTENGIDDFVSNEFCTNGVSLIAPGTHIAARTKLQKNSYIENSFFTDDLKPPYFRQRRRLVFQESFKTVKC